MTPFFLWIRPFRAIFDFESFDARRTETTPAVRDTMWKKNNVIFAVNTTSSKTHTHTAPPDVSNSATTKPDRFPVGVLRQSHHNFLRRKQLLTQQRKRSCCTFGDCERNRLLLLEGYIIHIIFSNTSFMTATYRHHPDTMMSAVGTTSSRGPSFRLLKPIIIYYIMYATVTFSSSVSAFCSYARHASRTSAVGTLFPPSCDTTTRSSSIIAPFRAISSHLFFDQEFEKAWKPTEDGKGFIPRLPQKKKKNHNNNHHHNSIHTVHDLDEYKRVVAEERDRIVCVRFYATWCRACKAIAPAFQRLAQQFPTVKFVEVPLTDKNAVLHQGLGIPSLPFAHIYHPEAGLVEEQKIGKKVFANFRDVVLKSYVEGFCVLPSSEEETEFE